MKNRTFIAVEIDDELRQRAQEVIRELRPVAGDVKWVAPENMHWTLQFLGDIDDLEIPEVCGAVATAVAEVEAFDLSIVGVGAFPAIDRPRTLWLGAGVGADAMSGLQATVERSLTLLGFRGEQRRYVPHLTLGRAGRNRPPRGLSTRLSELVDFDAGTMAVDEVTVYSSRLGREGAEYQVLAHAPLAP